MKHLTFYIRHALRDMTRNGRRTVFALFCIAAGVAAIVALRSLSLIIADSLALNIAGVNHGDIRVKPSVNVETAAASLSASGGLMTFTPQELSALTTWADQNKVEMTAVIDDANIQVAPLDNRQNVGRPQWISSFVIDPAVYPFYGPVLAVDPPNVPLSRLFTGGNDVVISQNLAENNKIKVGDQVRVGRTTELFTVRGIVPTDIESSLGNPLGALFGFAYFDKTQSKVLQLDANMPSEVFMRVPAGANVDALGRSLQAAVPTINATTTTDVRAQNQTIADLIDRLILAMGLGALLIGGTGIIHTMLVIVGRRTMEIAVLKTLGVQGRQITLMFLVESVIMGIAGSLIGVVLGVVFSVAVRSFTQSVWPQTLVWKLYPEAMLTGFLLGVIITAVFGFMPTLTAGSVRPAAVLRPNDMRLPAMGCFQMGLAILVVVIAVGLIAGQLVGSILIGLIGILLTAFILSILTGILWVLITVISHLPSFGNVNLRLALRGIGTHRARTASTLLALIAGIFSLSVITLVADTMPRLLDVQFTNALGGNVMAFALLPALQRPFIVNALKGQPGVERYTEIGIYSGSLVAVNGDRNYVNNVTASDQSVPAVGSVQGFNMKDAIPQALGTIGTEDVSAPGGAPQQISEGRPLGPEDAGKRNVVMNTIKAGMLIHLKVGDQLTFRLSNQDVTFTLVGMTAIRQTGGIQGMVNVGAFIAPTDAFPLGVSPTFGFMVAKVDDAHLNQTLVNLSAIPGVMSLDLGFFEQLIKRVMAQFTAIPTVVAVLSLFAGAVIIANTVSLSTLERRRQVGVMKAIGLKGWRVLLLMMLENGLVGLIGGLIGVGVGLIGTLLLSIGTQVSITDAVSWGSVALLLGLSLLISLVATLLSAWTAASEKPLNVLRYE